MSAALSPKPTPHFLDIDSDVPRAPDAPLNQSLENHIRELKREAYHYREMAAQYDAEIKRLETLGNRITA